MTKKLPTTPEIPLCINVLRMLSYRLAPDELIFFDWLIVKQIAFNYKPFHYSQARIEAETRIRRSRQEVIIEKFIISCIITTEVKVNVATRGRVRYFTVHFGCLADPDVLMDFIRPGTTLFRDFLLYMDYHAKMQKQSKADVLKPADKIDHETAARIYKLLNETFEDRRVFYNKGGLTKKAPERLKSAIQLQCNKPIERKLARLAGCYNDETIQNSFIAYIDDIFKGGKKPDNLMYYFLSFDEMADSFGVVDHYMNDYTLNYTYAK